MCAANAAFFNCQPTHTPCAALLCAPVMGISLSRLLRPQEIETHKSQPDHSLSGLPDLGISSTELNSVAYKENLPLPPQVDSSEQDAYRHLSQLTGNAFDREYSRDTVRDQTTGLAEIENEIRNGENQTLKNSRSRANRRFNAT
jgi:hypothetical protein